MPEYEIRLHWSPRSPFVRKIMVAAHEAGIADRLKLVRTVVSPTAPNEELLQENPLGKLPTLTFPDGFSLFDSPVIIEYFASVAPGAGLLPEASRQRLATLRHQALGDGLLDMMLLWFEERRRPAEQQSLLLMAGFATKFDAVTSRLEKEVGDLRARPFDAGHISIGCGLSYAGFRFPDIDWQPGRPALADWLEEFHERPSVRAVPVVDDLNAPVQPEQVLGASR